MRLAEVAFLKTYISETSSMSTKERRPGRLNAKCAVQLAKNNVGREECWDVLFELVYVPCHRRPTFEVVVEEREGWRTRTLQTALLRRNVLYARHP